MASCGKEQIWQAVANWAGVPVQQVNSDTALDGLGGKTWPNDGQPLIDNLIEICECETIPQNIWESWQIVDDIEHYMGK